MVTIKEIAKECNVSVATVSNILNHKPGASDETRRIVMAKIKELNYKPNTVARNLKTKNTRTIGVIVGYDDLQYSGYCRRNYGTL